MKKSKTVFVLIDALRSDYINDNDSPFLNGFAMKNNYYKTVIQSRSFCERSEIFTGLSSKESGFFTAIGYNPDFSPYQKIKIPFWFNSIEKILLKNNLYRRIRNKILSQFLDPKFSKMKAYSIPMSFLPYFSLTEDRESSYSDNAFDGLDNIFGECKKLNIKVYQDSFTSLTQRNTNTDKERLELISENINEDFDFYLLYIGIMDKIGHIYGPDSPQRKKCLRELDQSLEEIYSSINNIFPKTKFIFLGDHGMVQVDQKIDVIKEILDLSKNFKLKQGIDFIYFVDSTMLRVWYFNSRAKYILENEIRRNKLLCSNGIFIDENLSLEYEIPFPDRRYGDILWLANTGILVFPDFFHNDFPYKGMHGYDASYQSSKGVCLESSEEHNVLSEIKLTDIYKILKKNLNIP